jgi:hypothetical protein
MEVGFGVCTGNRTKNAIIQFEKKRRMANGQAACATPITRDPRFASHYFSSLKSVEMARPNFPGANMMVV